MKKEKGENVSISGFEPLEITRLLEHENEKFRISIVYSHQRQAVPASLSDLIICSDQMAFHPTSQFESLAYQPSTTLKQVVLSSKTHKSGNAALNYTFEQIEAQLVSFKKGKRLLVGRFCLCPPEHLSKSGKEKVKCRVVNVLQDKTCTLYNLEDNCLCEKPVRAAHLTFIESYGVSVYRDAPKMSHVG